MSRTNHFPINGRLLAIAALSLYLAGCQSSVTPPPAATALAPQRMAANVDGALDAAAAPTDVAARSAPSPSASASPAQTREAAKPIVSADSDEIPAVLLSAAEKADCRACVGDSFPDLELPTLAGPVAKLISLVGKRATVVLIWSPAQWTSEAALTDVQRDIAAADRDGVAVVGIGVGAPNIVQQSADKASAKFPQLVDAAGAVAEKIGVATPRVYVLDAERKIVWFDIDYSETTRRELAQTLTALGVEP